MSSDSLIFEESVNSENTQSEFVDRQFLYCIDNNNSSYSSQIVIDTTPLSNCGQWVSWSEAFITIPMILQIEAPLAKLPIGLPLDWAMGLKNGYWNILHSITCELNGSNIIQQVPFVNVYNSFKAMTTWCENDLKNWGAICGFFPDTARSWIYNNVAQGDNNTLGTSGTGFCNNRNAPYVSISASALTQLANQNTAATLASNDFRMTHNEGLAQRQRWLNFSLVGNNGANVENYSSNQSALLGVGNQNYKTAFMSYTEIGANTDTGYRAIYFDAIIRLKDVTDFYGKCPMMKGSTMKLYLNTNQVFLQGSIHEGTFADDPENNKIGSIALTSTPVILGGGGTCPVMLSSMDMGMGLSGLGTCNFQVALSIVKTQFQQMKFQLNCPLQSCRLYAPCYTMSPISESRYLSLNPTKKIIYEDIFQYSFPQITSSSNFNLLVTNGIANMKGVLVIPLINQKFNGVANNYASSGGATTTLTNTLLSPFSTTGGTPDPIPLNNFQIMVSGKNLFMQQQQFNFETFIGQLVCSNQLNGGLTTSLSSGLIGYDDFNSGLYRYYYGNVSRAMPSEDGVPKSIQLLGQNVSPVDIDLLVFIIFEKSVTLDIRSGQIIH